MTGNICECSHCKLQFKFVWRTLVAARLADALEIYLVISVVRELKKLVDYSTREQRMRSYKAVNVSRATQADSAWPVCFITYRVTSA